MEIDPVPFLNLEDYISHLLPDMDHSNFSVNTKKRHRRDDEASPNKTNGNNVSAHEQDQFNDTTLKDILTSLILLDEGDKLRSEFNLMEPHQHQDQGKPAMFNFQHQQVQDMDDYFSQFQGHYPQLDDFDDHSGTKRARRSAPPVAAAAAAAAASGSASGSDDINSVPATAGPSSLGHHHRRLWVKDRSKDWWERCSRPDFPEDEFRRSFRMSKATFDMICEELDSAVTKKNTMLRDAIPVRQRVAVCVWRLATGDPLRLVSKRFGLGISTCHKLVLEVCSAIRNVLMPKFIRWPDEAKMKTIKEEFESISGIPKVGGSMYTTHIPIIAPKTSVAAYFNKRHTERSQKTSYSITVQGVVDPNGVFTDVCIGWPGSMSDDQVLEKSALYERANRGNLKDVWIVGNSGYPLMDWLLVPYTHPNLTWTQHAFNEQVGELQKVPKEAFARLKGRWSCLQKRTEVKLDDLPALLGACCVLHNICEMRNEPVDPEWRFELFDDEMVTENGIRSASSMRARDQIAHYLLHHGRAGTGIL